MIGEYASKLSHLLNKEAIKNIREAANETAKAAVSFSLGALFGFYSAAICIALMRGNL